MMWSERIQTMIDEGRQKHENDEREIKALRFQVERWREALDGRDRLVSALRDELTAWGGTRNSIYLTNNGEVGYRYDAKSAPEGAQNPSGCNCGDPDCHLGAKNTLKVPDTNALLNPAIANLKADIANTLAMYTEDSLKDAVKNAQAKIKVWKEATK